MKTINGECLCGAVRFSFPDELKYALYCHCTDCRKFSGSVVSATGGIEREKLTIRQGAEQIGTFSKTEESEMCFCRNCGSSLFVNKPRIGMAHLRLGTLSEMPGLQPQCHAYVRSRVPWFGIDDGLPQFEGAPGRK